MNKDDIVKNSINIFGCHPTNVNRKIFGRGVEKALKLIGFLDEYKLVTLESRATAFLEFFNEYSRLYAKYGLQEELEEEVKEDE